MNIPLVLATPTGARAGDAAAPAARAPRVSPGLVSLKTSDTPHSVEIDSEKARFTRLKRSVLVAAKLFEIAFKGVAFRPAMLTLTYRDVDAFEPRHISELLKRVRHWVERRGHVFCYVWVAELRKRPAIPFLNPTV